MWIYSACLRNILLSFIGNDNHAMFPPVQRNYSTFWRCLVDLPTSLTHTLILLISLYTKSWPNKKQCAMKTFWKLLILSFCFETYGKTLQDHWNFDPQPVVKTTYVVISVSSCRTSHELSLRRYNLQRCSWMGAKNGPMYVPSLYIYTTLVWTRNA